MRQIYFYTPTVISYLDLISMGGSEKANDASTLGKYNSGLKYSMALALQNNIDFFVKSFDTEYSQGHDRRRETSYFVSTYTDTCEQTDKEKELILISKNVWAENFNSVHSEDTGGGDYLEEEYRTGFSPKLGIDWKIWMIIREIYSNMLDEKGYYTEIEDKKFNYGTCITLEFEEDSEFSEIWGNRHNYINEKPPLFKINHSIEALENLEGYLKIYKQNILVYENKETESQYAWNVKDAEIDEKRILSSLWSVSSDIISAIMSTKNEEFLRTIITKDNNYHNQFLYNMSTYSSASDLLHTIACEVYQKFEEVDSYPWLINAIKSREDCGISGRKIKTVSDSIYSYSKTVTIESDPIPHAEPSIVVEDIEYITPFETEIKKLYNFNLDVEVKKATLSGSCVCADKFNNCLIISEDFSIEKDFPEFLVQYLDLTVKGNVLKNLSEYTCNLLRK